MGGYALSVPAFEEEYIYRLRFSRNRYQDFFYRGVREVVLP